VPILGGDTSRADKIFKNHTVLPETANGCLVAWPVDLAIDKKDRQTSVVKQKTAGAHP